MMKSVPTYQIKGGYAGSVLWINLTTGKVRKERLNEETVRSFIGMRGFTSKLLWDRVKGIDAYNPKNLAMFAIGPLAGVTPTGGRALIASKSPLTGLIGYANFGGHWGPALKFAGYDLVVIEGKAETPVYLWIEDERVEIRDASGLWGKDTRETVKAIQKELGGAEVEVLAIGPAGENLIRFACVMTYDGHSGGRTGMGAVMGSKNLKAVAVRGTKKLTVANEIEYKKILEELLQHLKKDEVSGWVAPKLGTTVLLNIVNETGALGTRNFQSGYFDKAYEISGETMRDRFTPPGRGRACFMCPIGCDRYTYIKEGEFAGTWSAGGPEYATLTNQGARLGNSNLPSIIKANELCNRLGLDTYSTGGVLGFVFELYQRGILTEKETDGLELKWGDYKTQLELIKKIAYREGFGDLLAEGVKRIAEKVGEGAERYAIEVKGMEYPSKDARGDKMYGLCCATAGRGADHLYSLSEFPATVELDKIKEMFGTEKAVDPHLPDGKGKVVAFFEEGCTFTDLLGICKLVYVTYVASMGELMFRREVLPRLYQAVTGLPLSYKGLIEVAHRVTALERAFNIREAGIGRKDDYLPHRFLNEPMPDGPAKGRVFEADQMLDEYYEAKGFEKKSGWPYVETMKKLGLKKVTEELKKEGFQLPGRSE
jgi:aldehyde:ferredoxin oxidoreductase